MTAQLARVGETLDRRSLKGIRRAFYHGGVLAGLIFLAWLVLRSELGTDAYAYWVVDLNNLYEGAYGGRGFFPYSPVAALVSLPFGLLPWPVFLVGWIALLVGALIWLSGRHFIVFLALPPVALGIVLGNMTLLLAVVIVLSFRYPAAWAFLLLTKVTPGVGLLWYLVRREWRYLAIATGATAAVVGITFVFLPGQWLAWIDFLSVGAPAVSVVPLWPRIPFAVALVVWGALTNRRWTVVAGATLVMPRMGMDELSLLVGIYALARMDAARSRGATTQPAPTARSLAGAASS